MDQKIFADGFSFKRNESAPDFVVGRLSLKIDAALEFIKEHQKNGWINLDVKKARTGNFYIELDTFVSENKESGTEGKSGGNKATPKTKAAPVEIDNDDLPF